MGPLKGAFELSLSFIVIVVIAVILLSLAITFLQGTFTQLGAVANDVTEVAREELLNKLAAQGQRVGIAAPDITSWKRGQTGSYALGIKNEDPSRTKTFYINIYLDALGGDLAGTPVSSKSTEVRNWLTFSGQEVVQQGNSVASIIGIKPPTSAQQGIYLFRAAVCEAQPCTDISSTSYYGSAQFALEIVS